MKSRQTWQKLGLAVVLLCMPLTVRCASTLDRPVATIKQEKELRHIYEDYLSFRKTAFENGDIDQLELVTGGYELERIRRATAGDHSVYWESDTWDIEIRRFEVREYSEMEAEIYAFEVHDYEAREWAPSIVKFQNIGGQWNVVSHSPVHFD